MCGLCGNYNGNKTDDFTTRRGRLVKLTRRFARSWMVGGELTTQTALQMAWQAQILLLCLMLVNPISGRGGGLFLSTPRVFLKYLPNGLS